MSKVTVNDVTDTLRNLKRFENYARRHMDNLRISEPNENIVAARKLLADNVAEFEEMDVTSLSVDTTEIQERIDYLTQVRVDMKVQKNRYQERADEMQKAVDAGTTDEWGDSAEEPEWELEQVDYYTTRRKEIKREIKGLKTQL